MINGRFLSLTKEEDISQFAYSMPDPKKIAGRHEFHRLSQTFWFLIYSRKYPAVYINFFELFAVAPTHRFVPWDQ